jgi:hypothetical protein
MTSIACPSCHQVLPLEDVNVATDVALCRRCGVTHAFSDLLQERELTTQLEKSVPPSGVWEHPTAHGVKIGASHRSLAAGVGFLAISLFWNGIMSVFVLVNTASTLRLLGVPSPDWFPAPKMNGDTMGWGMTVFSLVVFDAVFGRRDGNDRWLPARVGRAHGGRSQHPRGVDLYGNRAIGAAATV